MAKAKITPIIDWEETTVEVLETLLNTEETETTVEEVKEEVQEVIQPTVEIVDEHEEELDRKRKLLRSMLIEMEWTHVEKAAIYPLFESLFR